ncbi:MAG: protein phosphatase 2C domain-containing protein [Treponema sp.]|nr:protein phosphatase 2C domain-containing protein [Treponema sp.]
MRQAAFAYSFQGSSHINSERNLGKKFPCQDRSFSGDFAPSDLAESKRINLFVRDSSSFSSLVQLPVELNPHKLGFSLACVSDGHGGEAYFRSQRGAELAVQTAVELLSESIDKIASALQQKDYLKINKNISKSFVRRWICKVMLDLASTKQEDLLAQINELEKDDAKSAACYKIELEAAFSLAEKFSKLPRPVSSVPSENTELSSITNDFAKLEIKSIYGCTAVVYFSIKDTPTWYAFKIGDSDFYASFDGKFVKPIADDPLCYENVTTSLCDSNAFMHFRFPEVQYLGRLPETVFLSSDGVADSFTDEDFFKKFYLQLQFAFDEDGQLKAGTDIRESLPDLSVNGSGDDVSLAGIVSYDDSIEAKRFRRLEARRLADKRWKENAYPEIRQIFKPYLERNERDFKYLVAAYDLCQTRKMSKETFSREFLSQWSMAFASLKAAGEDVNLLHKAKEIKHAIKELGKLMEIAIDTDVRKTVVDRSQDYIDGIFNPDSAEEEKVYSYYKALYEYKWLRRCFENGRRTSFYAMFAKTEEDLIKASQASALTPVENAQTLTKTMLSRMHVMMAKYWSELK